MSTAPAPPAARRDLRALFAPESVAVVGASDDPVKWGNWLARALLVATLAQPRGDPDQRPGAGGERVVDRLLHGGGRDGEDDELRGLG